MAGSGITEIVPDERLVYVESVRDGEHLVSVAD